MTYQHVVFDPITLTITCHRFADGADTLYDIHPVPLPAQPEIEVWERIDSCWTHRIATEPERIIALNAAADADVDVTLTQFHVFLLPVVRA